MLALGSSPSAAQGSMSCGSAGSVRAQGTCLAQEEEGVFLAESGTKFLLKHVETPCSVPIMAPGIQVVCRRAVLENFGGKKQQLEWGNMCSFPSAVCNFYKSFLS